MISRIRVNVAIYRIWRLEVEFTFPALNERGTNTKRFTVDLDSHKCVCVSAVRVQTPLHRHGTTRTAGSMESINHTITLPVLH